LIAASLFVRRLGLDLAAFRLPGTEQAIAMPEGVASMQSMQLYGDDGLRTYPLVMDKGDEAFAQITELRQSASTECDESDGHWRMSFGNASVF
jgi:hypothetical protein